MAFRLFDEPVEVLWEVAVSKTNPAEDSAKPLHQDAYSYSFYLFNPGKMMLVPDSSQSGKSETLRFDECANFLRVIEKDIKERITPRSTYGHLSNKFKNGQQFFTLLAKY